MSLALGVGIVAGLLAPVASPVSRALIGWNIGIWFYLVMMGLMMARADHGQLQRNSLAHAEGAAVVLGLVIAASVASVVAIAAELAWARAGEGSPRAWAHMGLAVSTLVGGWLLLPVAFTLNYASRYYHRSPPGGLKFPDEEPDFQPNYVDFLYFAFTMAVAAQTADVSITSRPMRRLALLQAVLSFGFNAAILALAINIAAGLLPSFS